MIFNATYAAEKKKCVHVTIYTTSRSPSDNLPATTLRPFYQTHVKHRSLQKPDQLLDMVTEDHREGCKQNETLHEISERNKHSQKHKISFNHRQI